VPLEKLGACYTICGASAVTLQRVPNLVCRTQTEHKRRFERQNVRTRNPNKPELPAGPACKLNKACKGSTTMCKRHKPAKAANNLHDVQLHDPTKPAKAAEHTACKGCASAKCSQCQLLALHPHHAKSASAAFDTVSLSIRGRCSFGATLYGPGGKRGLSPWSWLPALSVVLRPVTVTVTDTVTVTC